MIHPANRPRFAAVVFDENTEHAFSGHTIGELLRAIRCVFPAGGITAADPLIAMAKEPIDAVAAARALGVSKSIANARLARAWRDGRLIKLRRGVYQAAP